MNSKISEIFLSYQGEGPFAGSRQLFVRFFGCNLACIYCDTMMESYKTFSREALIGKILDFEDDYNELVITGGEPLLYADFLSDFLELFLRHRAKKIYLETNGTLPRELEKVIDMVDIIAMDIKLPSSGGCSVDVWRDHEEFIKIARQKELVVKAVITDSTSMEDIKRMGGLLASLRDKITVVLQPATEVNEGTKQPDGEMLAYFKGYLKKETGKDIMVLGQVHKCLGIK